LKRRETGILGEKLALELLKKKGYRILETNYRCPAGEIDIVARQRDCLVFVEVRTKVNLEFGTPEESITKTKMLHIKKAAGSYRMTHAKLPEAWRIDLVAIELGPGNKANRIEIIENALEE